MKTPIATAMTRHQRRHEGGATQGRRWSTPQRAAAVAAAAALSLGGLSFAAAPAHAAPSAIPAAPAENTLQVHADQPFRPVTHVASGALYGLASASVPDADLVKAIHPNTFVQMAPGGHQLPNGEPEPAGDSLVVAPLAAEAGAKVVVRMPDWYPNFPYKWVSWDDWLSAVDTQVKAVQASDATNIAAYELWNEPDWTWDTAEAGSFNDGWVRTYREVRKLDKTTPIQGPSYSDNISGMKSFLTHAVATDTVPDIISWHELESASKIAGDIKTVTDIEKSLGITPRPIAIEEYAAPSQVGIPGDLVSYIAKFERLGVQDAELAFWNHYGTLGDLLTDTGDSPNGAYWLYTWYGAMSGSMVTTTPPSQTGIDGAASVTANKKKLDIIAGGASGPSQITVDGLNTLAVGNKVDVKLQYTPTYGRTSAVSGPVTISDTTYTVGDDGSIDVPIVMNPAYGYHIVVTPATTSRSSLAGGYTITNLHSSLALDTVDSGMTAGTAVDQAKPDGSVTQSWNLIDAGKGLYKVQNAASGLLLAAGTSATDGAPVFVRGGDDAADQLWQLVPDGHGDNRLENYGTGLVLAVSDMGTKAGDRVVQWTDGSVTTACSPDVRIPGKIGTAFSPCGSGAYISLPAGSVSSLTGDYTVSAWVDPDANTQWSRVFDFGTGTGAYMFLTLDAGSGIRYAITTSGAGGEQQINGDETLPLHTWSLVTVTVAGDTGTLYVDGKVVGTNTDMTVHPSSFGDSDQNYLGKSQYGGDPALNASLDDVNIYDRALNADEVGKLAAGTPGNGDVAHYAFDDQDGATVRDSSGNGLDATIVPGQGATSTTATDTATADHFWTLHKVTISDAATRVPGKAVLSDDNGWDTGLQDGDYDITMHLWWGETASVFRLYENGALIATRYLDFDGIGAQSVSVPVSGRPDGRYVYTGELVNSKGSTKVTPDTVTVTQAKPAKPVLSDDDHTGSGSYTVTANLWWGTNATSYTFYENGKEVGSGKLQADTPNAQKAVLNVTNKPKGTYVYRVDFDNGAGTTSSAPVTVHVTR